MPDFSTRSNALEIMDDLQCSGKVVDQTLVELDFINKWLGGNTVTLNGLKLILRKRKDFQERHLRIADLGCGSGDMLKLLAAEFKKRRIAASLTGIDANPGIIAFAREHSKGLSEIDYQTLNILATEFRDQQYDIIFATLFIHHFSTEQLIEIFRKLNEQARICIIINDLHRHSLAYYSIKLLTHLFSRSTMVQYDAPLSVLRGFKKQELKEMLAHAGIDHYSLKWKWAFRWQLVIFNSKVWHNFS